MSQLFVGRLPRDTQSSELERIFEKYGKMSRCDVKRGVNSCYGFVEFAETKDAEDAIKQCDGMTVQGERIVVEMATGAAKRRNDSSCFRCGTEGKIVRRDIGAEAVVAVRTGMWNPSRSRNRDGRDGRDNRDNRDNRDGRDGRDNRHRGDRRDYRSRRHNGDSPHRRARSPRRHDSGRTTRRHSRSRSRSPAHGRRRDRSRPRKSSSRSPERRIKGNGQHYDKQPEKPFAAESMAA
ncbi:hypothetical protein J3B01_002910 [Coemansia erecta]|nr:hypothetical protein J3B01_002910 [Coemansia erecta]